MASLACEQQSKCVGICYSQHLPQPCPCGASYLERRKTFLRGGWLCWFFPLLLFPGSQSKSKSESSEFIFISIVFVQLLGFSFHLYGTSMQIVLMKLPSITLNAAERPTSSVVWLCF